MISIHTIGIIVLALLVLTFIIFIFVGAGFISNVLYSSSSDELQCVGLDNKDKVNIAKLTIVMFWIIFISLLASVSVVYYSHNN